MSGPERRRVPVWMLSPKDEGEIHKRHAAFAREKCKDALEAFTNCNRGRLLSTSWSCGEEKRAMMECMLRYMGPEFQEAITDEYVNEKKQIAAAAQKSS